MTFARSAGLAYKLVKLAPRRLRGRLLTYRQSDLPNIFLFSSRRGGSTFFSQLVEANTGIFTVSQPFEVNGPPDEPRRQKAVHLPELPWGQLVELTEAHKHRISAYVEGLTTGRLMHLGRIPHPGFPFAADRTFLKIVYGSASIGWLLKSFGAIGIHLMRHPAAQAISVMRNNWFLTTEAYLDNAAFAERFLTAEQLSFGRRIMREGNYWQRAVLNWVAENLAPLREDGSGAHVITYEELTLNPEQTVPWLAETLRLPEPQRMMRRVGVPSKSQQKSTPQATADILSGDRTRLVTRWQSEVDREMAGQAQEILTALDVGTYQMDSPLPARAHLRFESTAGLLRG